MMNISIESPSLHQDFLDNVDIMNLVGKNSNRLFRRNHTSVRISPNKEEKTG